MTDRIIRIVKRISQYTELKWICMALAVVVVFVTTYILILPAFTLDKDEAAKQGGIDVPASAATVDADESDLDAVTDTTNTNSYQDPGSGTEADVEPETREDAASGTGEKGASKTGKDTAANTDRDRDTDADAGADADIDSGKSDDEIRNEDSQPAAGESKNSPELVFEGSDYSVTIIDKNSILPDSVHVDVDEILKENKKQAKAYDEYVTKTETALGWEEGSATYARVFDIKIVDSDGNKFDIPEPVDVIISLADTTDEMQVVHFADDSKKPDVIADVECKGEEIAFEAESFSVYAVVQPPEAELDGKSYGIVNNKDTVSATALMGAANNDTRLQGKTMIVRTEPIKRTENVFVAENSDITMWTFRSVGENKYHITSEVNGNLKYLRIDDTSVTLVDVPDDNCVITVTAGAGNFKGKYKFSSNRSALRLNGTTFDRLSDSSAKNNANCWMNLAELSNLKDDDFVVYSAKKVSVSGPVNDDGTIDYDVKNGDQVIIYTRIWNDDTKKYDYYTVDYDGMLVKAYASGDTISWVGSKVNTMLWDFTEHYYEGTTNPNFYYDLQNSYSGKYIAPQVAGTEVLSDSPVGINLNGRRNGDYYSSILAWDDSKYDYASLSTKDYQLVNAPIAKADTFYFAVMSENESGDELNQVETLDHKPYGITFKMQDFGGGTTSGDYRSTEMNNVLGNTAFQPSKTTPDLLSKNITGDYPVAKTGQSLGTLFNNEQEVNHLFLADVHRENGYFEYDSTQNFAHLIYDENDYWVGQPRPDGGTYGVGDFVVYEELGTSSETNKNTLKHGQFFPYNDIRGREISTIYTNDMDIHTSTSTAVPLSSLDPRKGEALYNIPWKRNGETPKYVNHFFGAEMSASFMQSKSGLDEWGHDLIFDFSGDDDFWLYVDDMLVLDLGGIHSALDGSVNFRTGKVIQNGTPTTLRELYKEAYEAAHDEATEAEVNEWLNEIFIDDGSNTGTVFKPYTGHTMKMYYLERGAGASNLRMRFNLAPYKDGEVLLEKTVSGTDNFDADTLFPFQIFYREKDWPADRHEPVTNQFSVKDAQTGDAIPYKDTYEVGGSTYNNVFLLKAGQTASVELLYEDTMYYVTECGMDKDTYDVVTANEAVLTGSPAGDNRKDYSVDEATVAARKRVIYDNHVSESVQKNLIITKKLWKDNKVTPIEDDDTGFRFRIYIGKKGEDYIPYNTGKYRVKDPNGYYCIYQGGKFESTNETDFADLDTDEGQWKSEQEQATFHTSPGGIADKIPAGYSIEIPGLMPGTEFFVEERENEIPSGYRLIDYERGSDIPEGEQANKGMIDEGDETVIVNNQHGYGLTAEKVWSDEDFMEYHDAIYFAVYKKSGDNLELLPKTVRQLNRNEKSLQWFFPTLEDGRTLNDYEVYEVTLEEGRYTVDEATGDVTLENGYDPERIDQGGTLDVEGATNEHGYAEDFIYTADYSRESLTPQQIEDNVNNRTDTVKNSRPGIKLVKADQDTGQFNPLKGGEFTLTKVGAPDANKSFTSNEDGLIAAAYLEENKEYVLTETAPPYKYLSLNEPLRIKVDSDGKLYVNDSTGSDSQNRYSVTQVDTPTADNMPTVIIRNKPFTLQAKKVDSTNNGPITGVKFALYREVNASSDPMPDYDPMLGFEELMTDADGIIPNIDLDHLSAGTYYLRETQTTTQYVKFDYYIRLTISRTGEISIQKAEYSKSQKKWVFSNFKDNSAKLVTDDNGNVTLVVSNKPATGVRILKKDYENHLLQNAQFALYKRSQIGDDNKPKEGENPLMTGTTGANGLLDIGALDPNMTYCLIETDAPDGYILMSAPVIINTKQDGSIMASLENNALEVKKVTETGKNYYQITVYNSSGATLPSTGGSGRAIFYITGTLLTACCACMLITRRRSRNPR